MRTRDGCMYTRRRQIEGDASQKCLVVRSRAAHQTRARSLPFQIAVADPLSLDDPATSRVPLYIVPCRIGKARDAHDRHEEKDYDYARITKAMYVYIHHPPTLWVGSVHQPEEWRASAARTDALVQGKRRPISLKLLKGGPSRGWALSVVVICYMWPRHRFQILFLETAAR
jgi:hypothetical protein